MAIFTLDISKPIEHRTILNVGAGDWGEFTEPVTGLEQGDSLLQAVITIKRSAADADDAGTTIQKLIDATPRSTGVIDETAKTVNFWFTPTDTEQMITSNLFDVQVWVQRNSQVYIRTILRGTIIASQDITRTTSLINPGTTITIGGALPVTGHTGDTFQLNATVRDGGGNVVVGAPITWSSTNALIGQVDGTGLVELFGVGTCHIIAQCGEFALSTFVVGTCNSDAMSPTEGDILTWRTGAWTNENPETTRFYTQTASDGRFVHLNVLTTAGDIAYASGASTWARLGANTTATKKYLQSVSSGNPAWVQVAFADLASKPTTLAGYGITDAYTEAQADARYVALATLTTAGDIAYASGASTWARLAANGTGTNKYLQSVSSGVPAWVQIAFADLSGTPTTLGGYGITDAYTKTASDARYPLYNGTGASGTWGINVSGNAATATILATARAINGINFDGSAPITVTAAAGTLSGTTLNATVVTSSLTTVGALLAGSIVSGFGGARFGGNVVADTDAAYDFGGSGALRFRDANLSRNLILGGAVTSGAWNATVIAYNYGGTGQSSYAQGDFVYASATNTLAKLAIGTANYVLTSSGTIPQWSASLTGINTTGSAATLTTARALWGQNFDGSAAITGSLTSVGDITGGASSMTITPGTGNSRTLTLRSTTSGGTATTAMLFDATQQTLVYGNLIANTDNAVDIGASGANRFRSLYLSANATIPGTLAVNGLTTHTVDGRTIKFVRSATSQGSYTSYYTSTTENWRVGQNANGGTNSDFHLYDVVNGFTVATFAAGGNTVLVAGGGILGVGTTLTTGAAAGDLVLKNTFAVRSANNAGTNANHVISVDSSDKVRIDAGGSGTKFFNGAVNASYVVYINNTDATNTASRAELQVNAATVSGFLLSVAGAAAVVGTHSNHPFQINVNDNAVVTIQPNGTSGYAQFTNDGSIGTIIDVTDNDAGVGTDVMMRFIRNSSVAGSITTTLALVTSYNTTSDQRLKRDLGAPPGHVLNKLIVRYYERPLDGSRELGFYAQEAYKVTKDAVPCFITPGHDALDDKGFPIHPWMTDKAALVPELVLGWQEHDSRIAKLERFYAATISKFKDLSVD